MHARLTFILNRINADLGTLDLGLVGVVGDPVGDWGDGVTVFEFRGHQTSVDPEHVEEALALLASGYQDDVIDECHGAWPLVGGRPLWASADSGVACWYLDGRPWCAVGQLADALAAVADA